MECLSLRQGNSCSLCQFTQSSRQTCELDALVLSVFPVRLLRQSLVTRSRLVCKRRSWDVCPAASPRPQLGSTRLRRLSSNRLSLARAPPGPSGHCHPATENFQGRDDPDQRQGYCPTSSSIYSERSRSKVAAESAES